MNGDTTDTSSGANASAAGQTKYPSLRARLGPRLVHTPSEPSGSQRSPTVSSSRSFAQVAGAILRKQARGQNPDKDALLGAVHIVEPRATDQ
jgi:hypothetical protein